jgi:hypothetical protein
MSKREFRPGRSAESNARYPVGVEGRRAFLARLAGALAGGAAVSLLAACGSRPVGPNQQPEVHGDGGLAPPLDAAIDTRPDLLTSGGLPDAMPAPLDTSGGVPDAMPAPLDAGPALPPDGYPPPGGDS